MSETLGPDVKFIRPDAKGEASAVFGSLITATASNFPEPRFRVNIIAGEAVIDPNPFKLRGSSDGVGTKPEVAERLFEDSSDLSGFETSAYDLVAMIEGDAIRKGGFLVGLDNVLDVNSATNIDAMKALAKGLRKAADEDRFAITSGEIAELGYRVGGYGKFHFNWNAVGRILDVPDKRITGEKLRPGQPIVAFREESMRSNGYSAAYRALMKSYLRNEGGQVIGETFAALFNERFEAGDSVNQVLDLVNNSQQVLSGLTIKVVNEWHKRYPNIARELKMPSRLYSPVIYDAQGGVFGKRQVDMIAAAHITGGGAPLKGMRMVYGKGLGLAVDHVFPDPAAVSSILSLGGMDDMEACEQWNRGIGFMVVVGNAEEAEKLIHIAGGNNVQAAVAGEVIDKPEIQFRGHTWRYETA